MAHIEDWMRDVARQLPWDEAPEWAHWAAVDYDGEWCWFDKTPRLLGSPDSDEVWIDDDGRMDSFDFPKYDGQRSSAPIPRSAQFAPGDIVEIVKKAPGRIDVQFENVWISDMDGLVGQFEAVASVGITGIRLEDAPYGWPPASLRLVAPASAGYTPWNGGAIPIPEGTFVRVMYRTGSTFADQAGGDGSRRWAHNGAGGDIVAYKVLEEETPKDQKPLPPGGLDFTKPLETTDGEAVEYIREINPTFLHGHLCLRTSGWTGGTVPIEVSKHGHVMGSALRVRNVSPEPVRKRAAVFLYDDGRMAVTEATGGAGEAFSPSLPGTYPVGCSVVTVEAGQWAE